MPILWRYLIIQYLKMSFVCVIAFVTILLTMRLDDIAHFIALGAPPSSVLLFTLYQIPYILPIAIPISTLIASFILVQKLSSTHELTAFRACGFALHNLLTPILLTAVVLSFFNFWVVSEVSTQSHLMTNTLKTELRSINPLLLLSNRHLMRMKGIYFESLGAARVGESASDVILAIPDRQHNRLTLLIARHLKNYPSVFVGEGLTMISSLEAENEEGFDSLLVENIGQSETKTIDFSGLLHKKVWTVNNDYLKLSLLLARIEEQRQAVKTAIKGEQSSTSVKELKSHLGKSLADVSRRLSIALAVFSFTLMGASFGMHISRKRSYLSLYLAIFLTTFYLVTFFTAKGLDRNWVLATTLYLAPPLLLILGSIFMLRRTGRGIE